jgi:hypothetical protein
MDYTFCKLIAGHRKISSIFSATTFFAEVQFAEFKNVERHNAKFQNA